MEEIKMIPLTISPELQSHIDWLDALNKVIKDELLNLGIPESRQGVPDQSQLPSQRLLNKQNT